MTILQINKFFYNKGGSERVYFDTSRLLRSKGHRVISFSMQHPANLPDENERYFVSNIDYESRGLWSKASASATLLYSFEARKKIEELIRKEKPDIAHLHNIHHQISPSILHSLRARGIPVVMTMHDYKMVCASYTMLAGRAPCEACRGGRYYRCILKRCVKGSLAKSVLSAAEMYLHHRILHIYGLVDLFISPSRFLKDKCAEMGFGGTVIHLPNFVDLSEYNEEPMGSENTALYFGRLSQEKGLYTLLEAMRGLETKLTVVGDGPLSGKLRSLAESDAGLRNVSFRGHLTGADLAGEIRRAAFVVIPSEWYENNPRSVIEAFALGRPVIGARIGGIPELVENGVTGFTFAPGDAASLRERITALAGDRDARAGMGRSARRLVEERFSAEKHYAGLMDAYRIAIQSKAEK